MAPLIATEPSLVAGTVERLPLKDPIGVLTALTMTTSCPETNEKRRSYSLNAHLTETVLAP